jgi:hypothetical protein
MQQEIPTRRDLLERLESKIRESRRALVDAAATAGLQADQEVAYQRLIVAVDELLSRIRTALANIPEADPQSSDRGKGSQT